MNTLVIQDTFEPYYAGRRGYAAPDDAKRREPAEKTRSDAGCGDIEEPGPDKAPKSRPKAGRPEH